jgi:hypothetical protein
MTAAGGALERVALVLTAAVLGADQVITWWGGLADSLRRIVPGFVLRPWVGARRTHITPVARDQAEVVRVSPLPAGVDGLSADVPARHAAGPGLCLACRSPAVIERELRKEENARRRAQRTAEKLVQEMERGRKKRSAAANRGWKARLDKAKRQPERLQREARGLAQGFDEDR